MAVLCDALQELGVTSVRVRYEGCGDDGAVAAVEYEPDGIVVPRRVEDRLSELAEGYCPDGYENGDGGYGALTVYPFRGFAELEHCNRYEDAESLDIEAAELPDELRRRLAGLGLTAVTAPFDGYGDSGQIEGLSVQPESVTLGAELEGALEHFLLGLLPGGWETSGGSFGELTIDVPAGRVTADASLRIDRDSDPEVTRWRWRQ